MSKTKGIFHDLGINIRGKFKLYMSPEDQYQYRSKQIKKGLGAVEPNLAASFIANAYTVLTGKEYVNTTFYFMHQTLTAPFYSNQKLVAPTALARIASGQIYGCRFGVPIHGYSVFKELEAVKHHTFSGEGCYEMYNYKEGKIDPELLEFNPQFKDIIDNLITLQLDNPNLSLEEAMEMSVNSLKEKQKQRAIGKI